MSDSKKTNDQKKQAENTRKWFERFDKGGNFIRSVGPWVAAGIATFLVSLSKKGNSKD